MSELSISSLQQLDRFLLVDFTDGTSSKYPYIFLRDNCLCTTCFHPVSIQRLVHTPANIPLDIRPTKVTLSKDAKHILFEWPDQHETPYEASWLHLRSFNKSRIELSLSSFKSVHWGSELQGNIPTFQYEKLKDERVLLELLKTVITTGILLVKGVPKRIGQVKEFAKLISYLRKSNYGVEFTVKSVPKPSNLAYTSIPLPFHTDLVYFEHPPAIQILHCIQQSGEGGENIFVDGFKVALELKKRDKEAFDIITTTPFVFHDQGTDYTQFYLRCKHKLITLDEAGEPVAFYYSNQSRDSFYDMSAEEAEKLYKALYSLHSVMYDPSLLIENKLAEGEMVVFHNNRVLHGRKYFKLDDKERHLEGGYIDWDDILSRFRVLVHKYGDKDKKVFDVS